MAGSCPPRAPTGPPQGAPQSPMLPAHRTRRRSSGSSGPPAVGGAKVGQPQTTQAKDDTASRHGHPRSARAVRWSALKKLVSAALAVAQPPAVLVAQVVDGDSLGGRDVRHGHGLDGEDEDVLVEDLVVFHVCPTLRPLWYLSTL